MKTAPHHEPHQHQLDDHSKLHHLLTKSSHTLMNKLHTHNVAASKNQIASSGSSTSVETSAPTAEPSPASCSVKVIPPKKMMSPSLSRRSTAILPRSNSSSSSSDIFERCLNNNLNLSSCTLTSNLPPPTMDKLRTLSIASNSSSVSNYTPSAYSVPSHHSMEDYIAPVLDSTAEILTDPTLNYDDVQIVCCCDEDDEEGEETLNETKRQDENPFIRRQSLPNIYKSRSNSKSRSRSRSRSIFGTTLLNSINVPCTSPSSPTAGLSRSSKSTTSLYSRPALSPSHSHHHIFHNNTDQLISSKLQSHYKQPSQTPTKVIDFYSFADVCLNEQISTSPTNRNNSMIDGKLADDEDHILNKLNGYSINTAAATAESNYSGAKASSAPLGQLDTISDDKLGFSSRNSSSTSLSSPTGFTSMSMKDYMSTLP